MVRPAITRQVLQNKFFERGDIGNGHTDQIIAVSSHQVALHDFIMLADALLEMRQGLLALTFQADTDEHVQPETQRGRVRDRHVAVDDPCGLERPHPRQAR